MPQSLSRLLVHLVFSTKNRLPILKPDVQDDLHRYLVGTLNNNDCCAIRVGGVEDHVHLFFGMSRTHSIAAIVETVKTSSSKWIKTQGSQYRDFHWQSGYGAFSVSQSESERVDQYIRNQVEHHRKRTYQEEFRRMCELHSIQFDERYVWD